MSGAASRRRLGGRKPDGRNGQYSEFCYKGECRGVAQKTKPTYPKQPRNKQLESGGARAALTITERAFYDISTRHCGQPEQCGLFHSQIIEVSPPAQHPPIGQNAKPDSVALPSYQSLQTIKP